MSTPPRSFAEWFIQAIKQNQENEKFVINDKYFSYLFIFA